MNQIFSGFGENTEILMYDGTIKHVQFIQVGDLVMGIDSTPVKVLSISNGTGKLYKITPKKGDSYIVNESYCIPLQGTYQPYSHWYENKNAYMVRYLLNTGEYKSKQFSVGVYGNKNFAENEATKFIKSLEKYPITDIGITDFLTKTRTWKACWKGFRASVDFPNYTQETDMDPYLIGAWLGDGTSAQPAITTIDEEMIQYLEEQATKMCLNLINKDGFTYNLSSLIKTHNAPGFSNPFLAELKTQNLINNKHIPTIYLKNTLERRLQLLAGLIDTDGHLFDGCYEIIQKNKTLANDIIYLARSCGFACYNNECKKGCMYKGTYREGVYQRMIISGYISEIPVKIKRKIADDRLSTKNVLKFGISIKQIDDNIFYGFKVNDDKKFLLGDFTVTCTK